MARRILLILSLIVSVACMAQEPVREKKKFLDTKFGKFLLKVDKWMEDGLVSGVDSNYVTPTELKSYCYIGGYGYWNNYNMHLPFNLPGNGHAKETRYEEHSYFDIKAHCTQVDLELGIDYKGLTLFLPIPLRSTFDRSFGLAKNGSVWGFRIRYKEMRNMVGKRIMHADADEDSYIEEEEFNWEKDKSLDPNNSTVRTFYAEAYYVLNSKRFSLAAGLFGEMIQKRSAGGVFIYANYHQSRYSADDILLSNDDSFRTQQFSFGAGYGHNFAINHGKLLFHFSAVPLFTLYSHQVHKSRFFDPEEKAELDSYYGPDDLSFYDAADNGKSKFRINAFARFSAIYHINKRYLLTFLLNYRYYGYSNSKRLKIDSQEADAQLNFCVRF